MDNFKLKKIDNDLSGSFLSKIILTIVYKYLLFVLEEHRDDTV